jgi:hypothetical protein
MTPIGAAGILALGATCLVNLAVTHISEVKNLNDLASKYWPQVEHTYPGDKPPSTTTNNFNKG